MELPARCRVILEASPAAGSWNMAVDEALLHSAISEGRCTLRLYRWSAATLSLGYFQNSGDVAAPLRALPTVRRLSGGGAIMHHYEWTYSCAVPKMPELARAPGELYRRVHEAVARILNREFGVDVRLRGTATAESHAAPFLCFGRGDANDLMLAGHKILGSAQRRRRGAILQHGSLILRRSPHAPEFPGVLDFAPAADEDVGPALAERLAGEIGPVLAERTACGTLTERERERAEGLQRERYRFADWGRRRGAAEVADFGR